MARVRRFELDELTIRPGTYVNPRTEIVLIVDDSADLDTELLEDDPQEESEWILVSDEVPVDEHRRDELLERFQVGLHPGEEAHFSDDDPEEEDEELEPDEEHPV